MTTPSTLNVDIDALFAQTLRNYRGELVDNIFKDQKITAFLMDDEDGSREEGDGGERISETLMYGKNTTVSSYSGYDKIDTTPQDNVGEAYFDWKQIAGSVAISGEEQKKNKGESQIINMLNSKRKNLEMSMKEELNRQILNAFESGNGGDDLVPLPMLVAKDPSAGAWNPVGAIDGSTSGNEFWRNREISSNTGSTSTYQQLQNDVEKAYRLASLGSGGSPNVGICDHVTWGNYETALEDRKRYDMEDVTAKYGFDNIKVKQAALMYDEVVPDVQNESTYDGTDLTKGSLFFLNTEFLTLVMEEDTIFEPTEFVKPADQDAKVAQVLWMGALITSNRRKHSVLYNIEPSLSFA